MNTQQIEKLAKLIRYYILSSTTAAGSGHPTSSLSATDLMATLMFGEFFKFNANNPKYANNDRLIFSKGHAAPLFYALWAAAGFVSEKKLMSLRQFGSNLEGHPTMAFPFTETATGSLGQGLSVGLGMALNAKYLDKLPYTTYVLLGDSEMAEGSCWEAIQLAAHYKLDNLIGILDVNRLGQRGETMYGYGTREYFKRISSFGWKTFVIDGHSLKAIEAAYKKAQKVKNQPVMIIAKTVKGRGVSFLENKENWHGKALNEEDCAKAVAELGEIDKSLTCEIALPGQKQPLSARSGAIKKVNYKVGEEVSTRRAYGNALVRLYAKYPDMVVLDAETSNSTYSESIKKTHPNRFFEMFIAEQNMVGAALGLSRRGKIPFVSTFAAFFSRAFDQIRMCQYSDANISFVGSHAGVSIGEDGASQMGLEEIAMFRTLLDSVVLYPSDAVSCEKLVEETAKHKGVSYLQTTRGDTPVIYKNTESFSIGGSKVVKKSDRDLATVIGAGITVHEALKAYTELREQNIKIRVIDLYSVKPLDIVTLQEAAIDTQAIITVEDNFVEGGIGEAVAAAVSGANTPVHILGVRKMPRSGKPNELLDYEEISKDAIIRKVKEIVL